MSSSPSSPTIPQSPRQTHPPSPLKQQPSRPSSPQNLQPLRPIGPPSKMKDCQGRVDGRVLGQNSRVGPKCTERSHTTGLTRRAGFPGIWWMPPSGRGWKCRDGARWEIKSRAHVNVISCACPQSWLVVVKAQGKPCSSKAKHTESWGTARKASREASVPGQRSQHGRGNRVKAKTFAESRTLSKSTEATKRQVTKPSATNYVR